MSLKVVHPNPQPVPNVYRVGTVVEFYRWCTPGEALKAKRTQGDTELTINGRTVPASMTAQVLSIRHGRVHLLLTYRTPAHLDPYPEARR